MRLPYLQVTQETWDYARQLGGLLGLDVGAAFMSLCDLWRWGLSLGPEDQPPTGLCELPRAAALMAASVGFRGNPEDLAGALDDLGLIERVANGLRVRGMDRYRRTWEKNRRKKVGAAPETGTNPAPTAPEPAPQTQTQTQTQKEATKSIAGDVAPAASATDGPKRKTKQPKPEKPPDARHKPAQLALSGVYAQERNGSPMGFDGREAKALTHLLAKAGPEPDAAQRIVERWRRALRHRGYPTVATLHELNSHWNHFATDEPGPAVNPRHPVRAETQHFEGGSRTLEAGEF